MFDAFVIKYDKHMDKMKGSEAQGCFVRFSHYTLKSLYFYRCEDPEDSKP